jgi:ribosomal protein L40E
LFLSISAPLAVHVSIDGVEEGAGSVRIPVNGGLHKVSVPQTLFFNNGTRLVFTGWSDGYAAVNRTTMVTNNTYLSAVYSTQYYLNLTDVYGSATGTGWYTQGDLAPFSVPPTVPAKGILGMFEVKEDFQGWYEDGQFVSSLPNNSITMNAPHSLSTQWAVDSNSFLLFYLTLVAVVIMSGFAAIKLKRRQSSEEVIEAIRAAVRESMRQEKGTSTAMVETAAKILKHNGAPVKAKFCRECGAKITRDSKFCKECGIKQP